MHIMVMAANLSVSCFAAGKRLGNGHRHRTMAFQNLRHTPIQSRLASSNPFAKISRQNEKKLGGEPEPFTWTLLEEYFRDPDENNHFICSEHPKLELFRRSSAVQSTYLKHREKLKREWKSPHDYLLVNKFGEEYGFERASVNLGSGESQYESKPSLADACRHAHKNNLRYLSLVPNDFPYDVDDGIKHYCLWKIGGTIEDVDWGDTVSEGIIEGEIKWAVSELTKCAADNFIRSSIILQDQGVEHYATKHELSNKNYNHGVVDYLYWVNPPHLQSMPEILHAHIMVKHGNTDGDINVGNLDNSLTLSTLVSRL